MRRGTAHGAGWRGMARAGNERDSARCRMERDGTRHRAVVRGKDSATNLHVALQLVVVAVFYINLFFASRHGRRRHIPVSCRRSCSIDD
eukprot:2768953-Pleurochrysis_carterae.AAC.1